MSYLRNLGRHLGQTRRGSSCCSRPDRSLPHSPRLAGCRRAVEDARARKRHCSSRMAPDDPRHHPLPPSRRLEVVFQGTVSRNGGRSENASRALKSYTSPGALCVGLENQLIENTALTERTIQKNTVLLLSPLFSTTSNATLVIWELCARVAIAQHLSFDGR